MVALKKRFGVSIRGDVAHRLEILSTRLGMSRSSLVERALEEFIHDRLHIIEPHKCEGIMVVKHDRKSTSTVSGLIDDYRDVVKAVMHVHTGDDLCLRIMHVKGDSTRITGLERRLHEAGVLMTRYIVV